MPSSYLPTLGGVQELTRHLALTLRAAGDEVEIWWMQDPDVGRPTTDTLDGLTVRRFPFPLPRAAASSILPFGRDGAKSLWAMRDAVRAFRPDVLHVQCFGPNGAYATALSMLTRVPLVVSLQGETVMDDYDVYEHSTVMRTALRIGLKRAAAVTACSAFTLRDAEARFGLRPGRGDVLFNGVDLEEGRRVDGASPVDGRYVLALGRVVEKKGFDLLLRGFALVAGNHPDIALAIGGEGPELVPLQKLAAELGVADQVRFLGRLSRDDVSAAMNCADVFVMPSRLEPFGIVVLEAWRAGRPVIATSRGGPPEFIEDGVTGLLVDPLDAPAVARALDRLLSDAEARDRMGLAARQRVAHFGWPGIAAQYQREYATIATDAIRGRK